MKFFVPIIVGLLIVISAHAQQMRTLRIGGQAVTLTSDKRSSPALAVQMPEGDIWYGFLTSGTAPGRLTVQMPGGDVFSLIAPPPPNYTFSTILADFPQAWTWDQAFRNTNPRWNNRPVDFDAGWYNLTGVGIWPTYHIQATCSATMGANAVKGNPVLPSSNTFAGNELRCWCRLKRRSDGANGGWVYWGGWSTANNCASLCPDICARIAVNDTTFRTALFNAFANP